MPGQLRVLVLSPFPPRIDATHGGAKAIADLIVGLSRHCRIALVHLAAPDELPADGPVIEACERIEAIARGGFANDTPARWRRRIRLVKALMRGRPMLAADFDVPATRSVVRRMVMQWKPDVIEAEYALMGQYLESRSRHPTVLTVHEAAARGQRRTDGRLGTILERIDGFARVVFERRVLSSVDRLVVFTAEDRQSVSRSVTGVPAVVIPLAVPATVPQPAILAPSGPPRLLFVGSYIHPPNVDAALWLGREILPVLLDRFPDLTAQFVGQEPPPQLLDLAAERVEVTGRVNTVQPYIEAATIVVAPLRFGGGMRVKVLEALAAGKPMVATSLAVEGLGIRDGQEFLRADTTTEQIERISALLEDEQRRSELGGAAQEWARKGWTSEDRALAYLEVFETLRDGGADRVGGVPSATLRGLAPPEAIAGACLALDAHRVRWSLLRGDLVPARDGDDVDVLIHPRDFAEARRALSSAGFIDVQAWGRGSHRLFIGYDEIGDRWLRLDTVTRLSFGPAFALDTSVGGRCLARARRTNGTVRLNPADGFWALLLHVLIDRPGRWPSADQRRELAELGRLLDARDTSQVEAAIEPYLPAGWSPERMRDAVVDGRWAETVAAGQLLRAAWTGAHRLRVAAAVAADSLRNLLARHGLLGRRGALSVILVGRHPEVLEVALDLHRTLPMPSVLRTSARSRTDRYHRRRGRFVIATTDRRPGPERPFEVIIEVPSEMGRDARRRLVTGRVWREYAQRHHRG